MFSTLFPFLSRLPAENTSDVFLFVFLLLFFFYKKNSSSIFTADDSVSKQYNLHWSIICTASCVVTGRLARRAHAYSELILELQKYCVVLVPLILFLILPVIATVSLSPLLTACFFHCAYGTLVVHRC